MPTGVGRHAVGRTIEARTTRSQLLASASALTLSGLAAAPAHAQCMVTTGSGTAEAPASGDTIACADNLETDPILGPDASGVPVNVKRPRAASP